MAEQQFTQEELGQEQASQQVFDSLPPTGPEPKPKQTVTPAPALVQKQPGMFGAMEKISPATKQKAVKEEKVLPQQKEQPPVFLGDLTEAENRFKNFATFDSAEKSGATVASSMIGMGVLIQPSQNVFPTQAAADEYMAGVKRNKAQSSTLKNQAIQQITDGKLFQKLTDHLFGSPEEIIQQGGKVNKYITKNSAGQDIIDPGLVRKELERVIGAKGNNGGRYMKEFFSSRVLSNDNLDVVLSMYKNRDKIIKAMPTGIPKDQIRGFITEFEAKNAPSLKSQIETQDKLLDNKVKAIQQKYSMEITDAGVDYDVYWKAAQDEVAKEMEGIYGIYDPAFQESYQRRVKERFDERYAQYVMPKFKDITDRMTADIKVEVGKVNDVIKRIYKERNEVLNREFQTWSATKNKQLSDEFNAKVGSIIEEGVKSKRNESTAFAEAMINLSGNTGILGTAVTGKILGDTFTAAAGAFKNKTALILNALGFDADFIDEMRYSGKSTEVKYSMEKLPLEQNWLKPGYWAQSLAQSAPTMAIGMMTTALTGNPYVGGIVSFLSESVENSGGVMERVLENTGDLTAARLAGGETFIKNAPAVLSDILFQRMFSPLKVAKGTFKEKAKDLGVGMFAEGITERWQTAIEMSTGPDAKYTFGRAFGSKEAFNAQIEGAVSAGILGGGSVSLGGAYKALFDKKNIPSIRTQAIATTILTNGEAAAMAGVQLQALSDGVDDDTLGLGMKEVTDVAKIIEDAQQIGLNPQQTQVFTSLSKELADLNTNLNAVTDPSVRKALQTQIAAKEKEIEGIISGKTPIATIELQPGLAFTGTVDGVRNVMNVPEVKAEVEAGNVNIITDDQGLNAEVEQARTAAKPAEEVPAEAAPVTEAAPAATVEDIERRRQEELKKSPASVFTFQKINPDGANINVNDKQKQTIERIIQQAIDSGKSADEIVGILNSAGYVAYFPGNTGAADKSLRTYLNRRIDGTEKRNINEYASTDIHNEINAKYDAELASLQTIKTQEDATQISERAQQEIPQPSDIVQRTGTQEGQPQVGQAEGAVGQTTQPAADTGNRNLGSQAQEVTPPVAETAPVVEAPIQVDELLTVDTKVPTNLEKVFNFLDGIDNAIGKELNSGKLSDATRAIPLAAMQTIVKALKALVKGGMALQDAIKKVAEDNNYQEQDVTDAMNTIANIEKLGLSKQITEAEIPRFNRLMTEIQGIIDKSKERGVDEAGIRENVINYVQGSKAYEDANDLQREQLVRSIDKMFGVKIPSAPRVSKLLGIQNLAKVTMTEKAALKKQLRDATKGAKDAITAWRNASKVLGKDIKEMARKGQITAKQAGNIIKKFGKINILSPKAVSKFVDYMTKVFGDAEYENKLSTGKSVRKDISKLSKNKDKNANIRDVAKRFLDIDPSMVDDIDAYNTMANSIKESLVGSKAKKTEVSFAAIINIDDTSKYINDTLAAQQKKIKDETAAEIQELMGIDVSEFSYEDMLALLEKEGEVPKSNEAVIRAAINKAFGIYSSIIKKTLAKGEDQFSEIPFEISEAQKDLVNRFMAMDLNMLSTKDAISAVDALNNFITNKSTAKMDAVVSDYTGRMNAKKVKEKGIKSTPLKKYFSPSIGRILAEQTTSLGALFERMFKGVKVGGFVEDMFGLTKVKNGKAQAETIANNIAKEYVELYYTKKANGEVFNSVKNMVERGMIAFLSRNIIGSQSERDAEFARRKNLVKESIDLLLRGAEKEVEKGNQYKEIFDKLGVEDAKSIDEITKKADKLNVEAVSWWTNKWDEIYPQLSDVSQGVYNKILDKDTSYNPDRFKRVSGASEIADLANEESAFHYNLGTVYKKETGVLMSATRPETLPLGKRGKPEMYIDLSFDNNNASSMYDALVDIKTASAIRQVDGFLKSSEFDDIVNADDKKLLERRISLYVRKIRNKAPFVDDELERGIKRLNNLAAVGVGQALGGFTQPFKQVVPVVVNTIVNAGRLDVSASFDKDKNAFINRSGYAIANRGVESQAQIDSINRIIEVAASSTGKKAIKNIEKINNFWLKTFLVKPDAWIARSSWITYYEESLKEQGIDPSTINWSTHEVNEEAGNYAQRMVDRQQNISDPAQAGALFADSDNSFKNFIVKMAMPFASFRINQATRLANDLSVLSKWSVSTKEDKIIAARSLAGFAAEMATFRLMSAGISILIGSITNFIMGQDEEEEDYDKRVENTFRGQATGAVTDVLSPVPFLDKAIQFGVFTLADDIQGIAEVAEEDKVNIFEPKPTEFLEGLGLLGITAQRGSQLLEMADLSILDGSFEDIYGNKKFLIEKDKEKIKMLITPGLLSSIGILPSEVNSVVRKGLNDAKKRALTEKQMKAGGKKKKRGGGGRALGAGGLGGGGALGTGGFGGGALGAGGF